MSENQALYRLGYRADVEGLRAVAILLVVAAHAGVKVLRGGFVGVDVFYILSGYLITGLLVQEAVTTGHLGFARFYARRLRRLLPALLLMLAATCVVAQLLMPPTELPDQASNATGAALWLSNFQFAFWKLDYFAPSSDTALFLHTWSLGVEEQFYLVWPLLVVLILGAWKGANHVPNSARLKWLFVGIFAVSFALSLYWTHRTPMFAFYLMPSRAWQFALGAIVFLTVGSPGFRADSGIGIRSWLRPLGWLGLAMILFSAWFISPSAPYPGTWALLPSFGASMVLASSSCNNSFGLTRMLSLRPMQAIGRVSYSWYLWHWPVLLLGAALLDMRTGWNRLLLVLLSLLIATISYRFFETPIRHRKWLVAKPRWTLAGAIAVMLVAAVSLRAWQFEAKHHDQMAALAPFVAARTDEAVIYAKGCFVAYTSTKVQICSFGNPDAKRTAILIGDSKAAHWFPAYRQIFGSPQWRFLVITKSACPMVDAPYVALPLRREYTECARWREEAVRKVIAIRPDVVIMSESVTYPFTENQWVSGTKQVLHDLDGSVGRVYLMLPTPELSFNARLCAEPRGWVYAALTTQSHCSENAHTAQFDNVSHWLIAAATPFTNVQTVDMTNDVCPDAVCRSEIDGKIVFSDAGHMTATFARTLTPALLEALEGDIDSSPISASPKPRAPSTPKW